MKFEAALLGKVVDISQATRTNEDISRPASVRASIATFEQAQAIAQLKSRDNVTREDIEKAALISLQGRAEVSPNSQYYDNPLDLFKQLVEEKLPPE